MRNKFGQTFKMSHTRVLFFTGTVYNDTIRGVISVVRPLNNHRLSFSLFFLQVCKFWVFVGYHGKFEPDMMSYTGATGFQTTSRHS